MASIMPWQHGNEEELRLLEESFDELRVVLQVDDQFDVAQCENDLLEGFLENFLNPLVLPRVMVTLLARLGGGRLPSRRTTRQLQEALKSLCPQVSIQNQPNSKVVPTGTVHLLSQDTLEPCAVQDVVSLGINCPTPKFSCRCGAFKFPVTTRMPRHEELEFVVKAKLPDLLCPLNKKLVQVKQYFQRPPMGLPEHTHKCVIYACRCGEKLPAEDRFCLLVLVPIHPVPITSKSKEATPISHIFEIWRSVHPMSKHPVEHLSIFQQFTRPPDASTHILLPSMPPALIRVAQEASQCQTAAATATAEATPNVANASFATESNTARECALPGKRRRSSNQALHHVAPAATNTAHISPSHSSPREDFPFSDGFTFSLGMVQFPSQFRIPTQADLEFVVMTNFPKLICPSRCKFSNRYSHTSKGRSPIHSVVFKCGCGNDSFDGSDEPIIQFKVCFPVFQAQNTMLPRTNIFQMWRNVKNGQPCMHGPAQENAWTDEGALSMVAKALIQEHTSRNDTWFGVRTTMDRHFAHCVSLGPPGYTASAHGFFKRTKRALPAPPPTNLLQQKNLNSTLNFLLEKDLFVQTKMPRVDSVVPPNTRGFLNLNPDANIKDLLRALSVDEKDLEYYYAITVSEADLPAGASENDRRDALASIFIITPSLLFNLWELLVKVPHLLQVLHADETYNVVSSKQFFLTWGTSISDIHYGLHNGLVTRQYRPFLYQLTLLKTEVCGQLALKILKRISASAFGLKFQPGFFVADFATALRKAVAEVMPGVTLVRCYIHILALFRKPQWVAKHITETDNLHKILKAIVLLHRCTTGPQFAKLAEMYCEEWLHQNNEGKFAKYFEKYLGPTSKCGGMWWIGCIGLVGPTPDNNVVESYWRVLKGYAVSGGKNILRRNEVISLGRSVPDFVEHELPKLAYRDAVYRVGSQHYKNAREAPFQFMTTEMLARAAMVTLQDCWRVPGTNKYLVPSIHRLKHGQPPTEQDYKNYLLAKRGIVPHSDPPLSAEQFARLTEDFHLVTLFLHVNDVEQHDMDAFQVKTGHFNFSSVCDCKHGMRHHNCYAQIAVKALFRPEMLDVSVVDRCWNCVVTPPKKKGSKKSRKTPLFNLRTRKNQEAPLMRYWGVPGEDPLVHLLYNCCSIQQLHSIIISRGLEIPARVGGKPVDMWELVELCLAGTEYAHQLLQRREQEIALAALGNRLAITHVSLIEAAVGADDASLPITLLENREQDIAHADTGSRLYNTHVRMIEFPSPLPSHNSWEALMTSEMDDDAKYWGRSDDDDDDDDGDEVQLDPDMPFAGQSDDDDDDDDDDDEVQLDHDIPVPVAVANKNDPQQLSCSVCIPVQVDPEMPVAATTTKDPQDSSSDPCLPPSFLMLVTFQDAVRDFDTLLPWSNSTDEALNLPRQGFCHEKLVLEMYQWRQLSSNMIQVVAPHLKVKHVGNQFTEMLDGLFGKLHNGGKPIRPQSIVAAAVEKLGFQAEGQQDAHEFLVKVINKMKLGALCEAGIDPDTFNWSDLPFPRLEETTFIDRVFGGYLRSQLHCSHCGYNSNSYEQFHDLLLEISHENCTSLLTAFQHYTKTETLDEENKWKCNECGESVMAEKQLSVFRAPLTLCIGLKRFSRESGVTTKDCKAIQFPVHFDLPLSDGRIALYFLSGVVIHIGRNDREGHYTAYVTKPGRDGGDNWFHANDSRVEPVTEQQIRECKNAYILLYSRKDYPLEPTTSLLPTTNSESIELDTSLERKTVVTQGIALGTTISEEAKSKNQWEQETAEVEQRRQARGQALLAGYLQPLSQSQIRRLTNVMNSRRSGDDVIAQYKGEFCRRKSFRTLQPEIWLNDEVIGLFFALLASRKEMRCAQSRCPNYRRSHFFNSLFYSRLCNEGNANDPGVYTYKNVKQWSAKATGLDIFELEKVFFPINQGNCHWVCAVALMQKKCILFYDTLGRGGQSYLANIFRYLQDEHMDKNKCPLTDADKWQLIPKALDTPKQTNCFDCGVFVCMICDFLAQDGALIFEEHHLTRCRQHIALCILNKAPPNAYSPQMILNISNIDDDDTRLDQNH